MLDRKKQKTDSYSRLILKDDNLYVGISIKDFKATLINMFKTLKESIVIRKEQNQFLSRELEMIKKKKSQVEFKELKCTITEMENKPDTFNGMKEDEKSQ